MRMGRFSLTLLMMAITAVATYLGSLVAGVGGATIGAASGVGVSALGEAGIRWLDARDTRRELRQRVFLPSALSGPEEETPSLAALLLPARAIVPFIGRE